MRSIRSSSILLLVLFSCLSAAPLLADSRIEKELSLAPGGRLALDTDSGSVEVVGRSGSGVRVVVTSTKSDIEEHFDLTFEERAGEVLIEAKKKGSGISSWFNWGGKGSLRYEIEVPRETSIDIDTSGGSIEVEAVHGDARLDTSGGAISVHDLGGELVADTSGGSISIDTVDGDVNADTSGGSIRISDVNGNVRADTSGGSIQISGVSGDLEADTSGGSIRISDAGGEVVADTSGGSVEVSFVPGNDRGGSISASGGGIRVALDPGVGLEIDAQASGGSVTSDVPVTIRGKASKSTLRGQIGAGGARLKLRSSGGPIRISSST